MIGTLAVLPLDSWRGGVGDVGYARVGGFGCGGRVGVGVLRVGEMGG